MGLMHRLKIWICILFHKKEIKAALVKDELFTYNMGTYKGCRKCDLWQQIENPLDRL